MEAYLIAIAAQAAIICAAAYAGSKYGTKAGAAVAAVEARLKALEATAVSKVEGAVKAVEAKL